MSNRRLPSSDFLPYAPENRGTVRVNHRSDTCDGDSKSLIITRREDNSVTAHCFRCGGRGWTGDGPRHFQSGHHLGEEQDTSYTYRDGVSVPTDLGHDYPEEVLAWLRKSAITAGQAARWGFGWSEAKQQLYIPVVQETSAYGPKALGHVLRRFQPKRYLTLTGDKDRFWGLLRGPEPYSGRRGTLLLVEDMLSAYKAAGAVDTLALLGVNLRPSALAFILEEGYREAVVWLDADNPQVRLAARRIAQQLTMPTRIIETLTDPKQESVETIRRLVNPLDTATGKRYNDREQ